MSNSIVFVGGKGLVGKSATTLFLEKGYEVYILDLEENKGFIKTTKNLTHICCDIHNKFFYKKIINKIPLNSYVINLAARQYANNPPSISRLDWFLKTNLYGGINVLDFAIQINAKGFIQFSTDMVYGKPKQIPVKETHSLHPIAEYGESKKAIEDYILKNREKFLFPITILRPRLILGPGRLGVFKNLFNLIKYNLPVPLIGNGSNFYQMVSDRDCAKAIYLSILKKCPNTTFNLGSNVKKSVYEQLTIFISKYMSRSFLIKTPAFIIKYIFKFLEFFKIEILFKEQYELADKHFVVDIKKAKKILNWVPEDDDQDMLDIIYKHWLNKDIKENL